MNAKPTSGRVKNDKHCTHIDRSMSSMKVEDAHLLNDLLPYRTSVRKSQSTKPLIGDENEINATFTSCSCMTEGDGD